MRALLSTRIFAARRLDCAPLHLARRTGFPEVEIHAAPEHFDPFDLGAAQRAIAALQREGMRPRWLHVGAATLNQLGDERRMIAFRDVVRTLRVEAVVADTRAWGVRQDAGLLRIDDLKIRLLADNVRLVLDLRRIDERIARRLPSDLGLCWDMAGATAHDGEAGLDEVRGMFEGLARGRILGVRAARLEDGRRGLPDRQEARLLEEVWRLQAPGTLVYDVDDPSGFGVERELRDTLEALCAFHGGAKRDHPEQGGGLFWSSLAPG